MNVTIFVVLYMYSLLVVFFFNDTATTEIYTYLHTLSLHDALPIYLVRELVRAATVERKQRVGHVGFADGRIFEFAAIPLPDGNALFTMLDVTDSRSEEHTSELQSLMRISYAVFCLKTKKHNRLMYRIIYTTQ